MKKILRWGWTVIEIFVILYVVLITTFILCKNKYGYTQIGNYTFYPIMTTSDVKELKNSKRGDLYIVTKTSSVKKGDSIYYYSVENENYVIRTDKVVELEKSENNVLYTVEKDKNVSIASARVVGKKVKRIGKVGELFALLEEKTGFLVGVLLPIVIVFIYQVFNFISTLRYEEKKKEEKDEETTDEKEETIEEKQTEEEPKVEQTEDEQKVEQIEEKEKKKEEIKVEKDSEILEEEKDEEIIDDSEIL